MYLLINYYYFIFNHIHIKPVLYFMCCCSQDDLSKETVIYVIFLRQQQNHFTCTQSSLPFLRSKGIDPSNTICTCTYVCGCLWLLWWGMTAKKSNPWIKSISYYKKDTHIIVWNYTCFSFFTSWAIILTQRDETTDSSHTHINIRTYIWEWWYHVWKYRENHYLLKGKYHFIPS